MTLPAKPDVDKLIKGSIKGDRRCQEMIFEMFYGKMMGVCLRYCKDADTSKDILQEGFIKVFKKLKHFNGEGSFEGWIRRIMVNTAIDHFRKERNSLLMVDSDYVSDFGEDAVDDNVDEFKMIAAAKQNEILRAVQKLSPAYKTVFNLYVIEGYSHKEIADMLGISIGSSKSNLAKAKRNLKRVLKNLIVSQ